MPRNQPHLHEAMLSMLSQQPHRTATLKALAEENIRLDLYRQRKGDGTHPKQFQFKLRTFHHDDLEFLPPDRIRYICVRE